MITTQLFELFGTVLLKGDQDVHSKLSSLDKKGQSVGKSMGLSFSNIASAAMKLGAILGLGLGIKTVIDSAFAGQKNLAQMEAVLKSTGGVAGMTKDALISLATAQSRVTTFSKGATMQAENMLLTFRHIGKDVFPETIKATEDMATAMKMDATSAAKLLGKAMDDPQNGLTKLTRAGVLFTDAQKAQIIAMQKSGDTMGAQKIILGELEKEFGGSAEAAGKTFPGQLQILQNALTSTGGAVVNKVLPALSNFVNMINVNMPKIQATIMGVVDVIVPKFQEWIKIIGQIANEAFPNLSLATGDVKGKVSLFKLVLDDITKVLLFVRDNVGLVKDALKVAGAIWILQTGFVVAHSAALLYNNIQSVATGIKTAALAVVHTVTAMPAWIANTGAIVADSAAHIYNKIQVVASIIKVGILAIAHGAYAIAAGIASGATWAFTAALEANPIGIIVIAIIGLGVALYQLVIHWKEVTRAISDAFNALMNWNRTPISDKNAKVVTTFVDQHSSNSGSGGAIGITPGHAAGTDYFGGGLTHINELGGEIIDLPRGSRIIPHDVSMEMAKSPTASNTTINFNGNNTFADKNDIDYFMNQAAVLIQRRAS